MYIQISSFRRRPESSFFIRLDTSLMELLAIRQGCQKALHSHLTKLANLRQLSHWLTPTKSLVIRRCDELLEAPCKY
jgi:hypothetical protein